MPRSPRIFVDGAMYHVYNKLARGGRSFEEDEGAQVFVDLLKEIKKRDGLVIYAWAILPTHFHILLRTVERPLWRSMASLASQYSRWLNRREKVRGPAWQSRYKAKLVEEQRYFDQLVVYIHLNPVVACLVQDPAEWRWSGHAELVTDNPQPLLDCDEMLMGFGQDRKEATRAYIQQLRGGVGEPWTGETPGRLPWWRFGAQSKDQPIELREGIPFIHQGRSSNPERPQAGTQAIINATAQVSDLSIDQLLGSSRAGNVVLARLALAVVACDRYRIRVKDLASATGKRADLISRWLRRGAVKQKENPELQQLVEAIDQYLQAGPS